MSRSDVELYAPALAAGLDEDDMANVQVDEERVHLINKSSSSSSGGRVQNVKLFLCTAVVLLAAFSLGYSLGYSSPGIPSMRHLNIINSNDEESWFGSILALGAILGGPIAGLLLDMLGRKLTVMLCAIPFVAGWVAIATARGIYGLYIGRILTGIGAGMASLSVPVYIAEMSSPNLRGLLGSSFQLVITLGILTAYALGIPLNYKYLALVAAGLAAALITLMSLMPDTARYMLIKHQRDKALRILEWLRGPTVDVDTECRDIEDGLDNQEPFSILEFTKPSLYKPLMISVVLMFFQQWSGINAVMFYTVDIFKTAAPTIDAHISTVIVGVVQVVATLVSVLLMDRAGRRVLLLLAGVGMALSSTTFGLYYNLTEKNCTSNNHNSSMFFYDMDSVSTTAAPCVDDLSWLSLTSMVVYIVSFSLGWGPIPWLLMSEIFPSKARGAASAIATASNWIFAFAVTKSFLVLKEDYALGENGVFYLFAGICAASVIFVALFVPETKGLALEAIEAKFDGRSHEHPEV
ncbi:solute carrier family 2, facilitated glucose transporter member 8-like [Amphiura filiformis]|uniref:solute carrier family 2, facilitated glucose transporter member 8-like n=1 Tax=Amphiura filiformis TaxID=82378 RepID=UPI003B2114B8